MSGSSVRTGRILLRVHNRTDFGVLRRVPISCISAAPNTQGKLNLKRTSCRTSSEMIPGANVGRVLRRIRNPVASIVPLEGLAVSAAGIIDPTLTSNGCTTV